jgi:hypothetical protein
MVVFLYGSLRAFPVPADTWLGTHLVLQHQSTKFSIAEVSVPGLGMLIKDHVTYMRFRPARPVSECSP